MSPGPHLPIPLSEKLVRKFHALVARREPDECWFWTGRLNAQGYGVVSIAKGADTITYLAHRIAYVVDRGEQPPAGNRVIHSCDTPPCCNPRHLRAGTHQDNYDDMRTRGRARVGEGLRGRKGTAHPRSLYDDAIRAEALRLYREERWNRVAIAAHLGCHRWSVSRWIRDDAGIAPRIRRANPR